MRRRLQTTILSIAVLVVVLFGLPLALAADRFYSAEAFVQLQRDSIDAGTEISSPVTKASLVEEFGQPAPHKPSYYDQSGARIYGPGPRRADRLVRAALAGESAESRTDAELVVVTPVSDAGERVIGAVRLTRSSEEVSESVQRAWWGLGVIGVLVIALAWFVARWQARRLGRPVDAVATAAERLGEGDFSVRAARSGIPEIDALAAAFDGTAARLGDLVDRERAFSADASHQLRTPLAALKLRLELAERRDPGGAGGAVAESIAEVDRLYETVQHLLARARGIAPVRAELDVGLVLEGIDRRWQPMFDHAGRGLEVRRGAWLPSVRVSMAAVAEIVDALVDNALTHGEGTVLVRVRSTPGGLAIDVSDEGPGISEDAVDEVFERHQGRGTGIGLALARSLAEAEGGRLVVRTARPPCFSLVLVEHTEGS